MNDEWLTEMHSWCAANPESPVPAKFFLYVIKELNELTHIVKESERQLVELRQKYDTLENTLDETKYDIRSLNRECDNIRLNCN